MFCKNCGATISDVSKFCRSCGCAVVSMPNQLAPEPMVEPKQEPEPEPPKIPPQFTFDPVDIPIRYQTIPVNLDEDIFDQSKTKAANNFLNSESNNYNNTPTMKTTSTNMGNNATYTQNSSLFSFSVLLIIGVSIYILVSGFSVISETKYYNNSYYDPSGVFTIFATVFTLFPIIDAILSYIVAKKLEKMETFLSSFGGTLIAICLLSCIFTQSYSSDDVEKFFYLVLYPYKEFQYYVLGIGVLICALGVIDAKSKAKLNNMNFNNLYNNRSYNNSNFEFNNPNMMNPNQNYHNSQSNFNSYNTNSLDIDYDDPLLNSNDTRLKNQKQDYYNSTKTYNSQTFGNSFEIGK